MTRATNAGGPSLTVREGIALAPYTTLGVGGPARWFVEAADEATLRAAVDWARARRAPLRVLGGGSNVVVPDAGVDALVVQVALRGVTTHETRAGVDVTAAAGEPWDDLVAFTVAHGWAGLECLSGIPGLVGATPMQNVGAYGQEVSDTVVAVRVLDTTSGETLTLSPADCGFGYRDSAFKSRQPGRYVVLAVTYRLRTGGAPMLAYADVTRDIAARGLTAPTLSDVRTSVLAIRRTKSMVLVPGDPNRRSCGSFFTNPIVTPDVATRVAERAGDANVPRWAQPTGGVKLSAAWLIERAGFRRGQREGAVGLSTAHALAIVAHDGARATDVLAFARRLQETVVERFGVTLALEPAVWA